VTDGGEAPVQGKVNKKFLKKQKTFIKESCLLKVLGNICCVNRKSQ